ncbi:MAG: DUF4058 family protein [Phormidesmis sp.]
MPIPFPGMNPYLEHPDLWPQVHQKMIQALADTLDSQLPASYQARLRERHYRVSGEDSLVVGSPGLDWSGVNRAYVGEAQPIPGTTAHLNAQRSLQMDGSSSVSSAVPVNDPLDELSNGPLEGQETKPINGQNNEPKLGAVQSCPSAKQPISVLVPVPQKIYETYLEIVDASGTVVTVIEALSPKKKRPGRGRMLYERQREAIFGSDIHFVEIDLLRGWEPASVYGPDEAGDYRILISRSEQRPRAQLYAWKVTEPIPQIMLPLSDYEEMPLCLKSVVDQACDRTDLLVNYQQDPLPPLRDQESLWLESFLQQVGMRPYVS